VAKRMLLAVDAELAPLAAQAIGGLPDAPKVVPVRDGARCLTAYTKLTKANQPPLLIVLDTSLPRIEGRAAALMVRAIERGAGKSPTAILFYTTEAADNELKALLKQLGRAVHMQRPPTDGPADAARRLGVAVGKLLAQLGGK
jgi:CheY-like chemotaxis protein